MRTKEDARLLGEQIFRAADRHRILDVDGAWRCECGETLCRSGIDYEAEWAEQVKGAHISEAVGSEAYALITGHLHREAVAEVEMYLSREVVGRFRDRLKRTGAASSWLQWKLDVWRSRNG